MKFKCIKNDLIKAVDITGKIVTQNQTLPVLSCIVFDTINSSVRIRTTNLEISIEGTITANISSEGSVAVPASVLINTLKTLPKDKDIVLESDGGNITITTSAGKTTIKSLSTEEFPDIPKPDISKSFNMNSSVISKGIQSVVYSSSISSIKPELSSVYIYSNDSKLTFVATDSFRLAEKSILFDSQDEFENILIPFRNANELMHFCDAIDGEIEIFIDENQFSIKGDNLFITSRIIDAQFPNYTAIIPKEVKTEVVILKQDIVGILRKATLFSGNLSQIVFSINPENKEFKVYAKNNDVGEMNDSVECAVKGEQVEIKFNHRYIADCLSSVQSDSIILEFAGMNAPLIIKGVSDDSFRYLVMPMNK